MPYSDARKVVLVDPTTGAPYAAGGGGGGGTSDATAANQTTEIARLTSILGQLPGSTVNPTTGAGGQATYGTSVVKSGTLGALNAVALDTFDAQNFQSISIQVSGTWVGQVVFEVTNDPAQGWITKALTRADGVPASGLTNLNTIAYGDIGGRYIRARMQAYTSGTATVTAVYDALSLTPPAPGSVSVTGAVNSSIVLPTAGGVAISPFQNAAVIAPTLVKGAAGRILQYRIFNPNTVPAYLNVYNVATAAGVTVGTTPVLEWYPIPAGAVLDGDHDFSFNYSTGIVIAATTTPGGATASATGLVVTLGLV